MQKYGELLNFNCPLSVFVQCFNHQYSDLQGPTPRFIINASSMWVWNGRSVGAVWFLALPRTVFNPLCAPLIFVWACSRNLFETNETNFIGSDSDFYPRYHLRTQCTHTYSHTGAISPKDCQFTKSHVFGSWEETKEPGGNPHGDQQVAWSSTQTVTRVLAQTVKLQLCPLHYYANKWSLYPLTISSKLNSNLCGFVFLYTYEEVKHVLGPILITTARISEWSCDN